MRLKTMILLLAAFGWGSAWAELPKLAVLDVGIPKGYDSAVVIPITESLMEQFVASGNYIVLDRANIEAIFKEREFQYSGEVSNDQISQAGQFLGAAYVVVSKLQQIGDALFLSAKMIDTRTAAIVAQTSDSRQGKIQVVIEMAKAVGAKLSGAAAPPSIAEPAPGDDPGSRRTVAQETRPAVAAPSPSPSAAAAQAPAASSPPAFRMVAHLELPLEWTANLGESANNTAPLLQRASYLSSGAEIIKWGWGAKAHLNLGDYFYLMVEYNQALSQIMDSLLPDSSKYYTDMSTENILGGIGVSLPLGNWGQIFGGAQLGASSLVIGDLYTEALPNGALGTLPLETTEIGLGYGAELGMVVFLGRVVAVELSFRVGGSSFNGGSEGGSLTAAQWYTGDASATPELGYSSILISVGLAL